MRTAGEWLRNPDPPESNPHCDGEGQRKPESDRERVLARRPDTYATQPLKDRQWLIASLLDDGLVYGHGDIESGAWTSAAERMDKGE